VNPVESAFRAGAAIRRSRIFHPQGAVFEGVWRIERDDWRTAGATIFQRGFEQPALVRLSRGTGLPGSMPDIHGIALRLPHAYGRDRHQDILCNSSIDAPVLHHLLLPSLGWFTQSYTSSLPYRAGEGPLLLVGFLPPDDPEPGPSVDDVAERVRREPIAFGIAIASLGGRWRRIGTLTVQRRAPERDELRFDPLTRGGGFRPAGMLQRLRRAAYRGSRRGAPAAR
jgi:hypothetical protein